MKSGISGSAVLDAFIFLAFHLYIYWRIRDWVAVRFVVKYYRGALRRIAVALFPRAVVREREAELGRSD
jgi:hypothetical protein